MWEADYSVYGYRKIWRQLLREGARLMKQMGIVGVRRGRKVKTTVSAVRDACPEDLVDREFVAEHPNNRWVADFT